MTYQKPEINSMSKALAMVRGSSNKTLDQVDSQSPPDQASIAAYESDE